MQRPVFRFARLSILYGFDVPIDNLEQNGKLPARQISASLCDCISAIFSGLAEQDLIAGYAQNNADTLEGREGDADYAPFQIGYKLGGYLDSLCHLLLGQSGILSGRFDLFANLNVDFLFDSHKQAPSFAISLAKTMLDKHNATLL